MRIFREENIIIKHLADITPDPPDTIFVIAVPLVHNDNIFDVINKHEELSADQRFPPKYLN
jgi:hypothetical protein